MTQETRLREKDFEQSIEDALLAGGYKRRGGDTYDREKAMDVAMLMEFLRATQPRVYERLRLDEPEARAAFLDRVREQLRSRGVIDVLCHGVSHNQCNDIRLYYAIPDAENAEARAKHEKNSFGVIRQLTYTQPRAAKEGILDMALSINGIPVVTLELKNEYSGQDAQKAIEQYKRDRDPKEELLTPGRCAAHFAVDTHTVYMCPMLSGGHSRFLPFNRGKTDGSAGNPPIEGKFATSYLWEEILQPESLCDIIEHYAYRFREDVKGGKPREVCIFPRFHQLDAVRRLLADVRERGVGQRYLIQHSAGSGKSNTITWLVLQLINIRRSGGGAPVFDAVVVVTDRRNLDKQLNANIRRFSQTKDNIRHVETGKELREAIASDSSLRIVVSTIQKFPVVLREMPHFRNKKFAIVIDEAHSSQGGENAKALNQVLGAVGVESSEVAEDDGLLDVLSECLTAEERELHELARQRARLRRLTENASYFAFTATPKPKTLRMFGRKTPTGEYAPFHIYTMKQAVQEGFILDVLANYTPIQSYFRLKPRAGMDETEEYDAKKAPARLKRMAENHPAAIHEKARIMVEHFLKRGCYQIGGKARAMVVCAGIRRAVNYYGAIEKELRRQGSDFRAIVAFSGTVDVEGESRDEAQFNGFSSNLIEQKIREEPYRILVVADKFQTGYDEPLMQTMYVDKPLSGVRTVQTLSRLNRAYPGKYKTFVLDFYNDEDSVLADFAPYYKTTVLSGDFDPNRLHDMKARLDGSGVYTRQQVTDVARVFLTQPEGNQELSAMLDVCRASFGGLSEDAQIEFKGTARGFVRSYDFISSVLPYENPEWEELACFLRLLLRILPAISQEDDDRITSAAELDSYRAVRRETLKIDLPEGEGTLQPPTPTSGGSMYEPEPEPLSDILTRFNDTFGNIRWEDKDRVRAILGQLVDAMAKNRDVMDAIRHSGPQNARLTLNIAVGDFLANSLKSQPDAPNNDLVEFSNRYYDSSSDFNTRFLDVLLEFLLQRRQFYLSDQDAEPPVAFVAE